MKNQNEVTLCSELKLSPVLVLYAFWLLDFLLDFLLGLPQTFILCLNLKHAKTAP